MQSRKHGFGGSEFSFQTGNYFEFQCESMKLLTDTVVEIIIILIR
jgi:hypothetical protein